MWIINERTGTKRLTDREISEETVEFNAEGKARVKKDIGKAYAEKYPTIEVYREESE